MGFFEKQKSFGRRCGGTVAMRPWSSEFCCVRILASSLEAFPTEFSKTLFGIFTPKTCSKTSANLFAHPITSSRMTAVTAKYSNFDGRVESWQPSWLNFQKLFLFYFYLKTCSKTLANLFVNLTRSTSATAIEWNCQFLKRLRSRVQDCQ